MGEVVWVDFVKAISVIVSTHNRLRYLDGSFGSLLEQTLPREKFEIILVDNASTDGTRDWAGRAAKVAAKRGANFTYLHETALGLSHARNAGWRAAKADIVAFLDDDAVANSDWLERIVEVFERRDENLAVVGGKVEPLWEAQRPDWLEPELWGYLSVLDWSPNEMILEGEKWFVGANMSIRKSALARAGGFSGDLGRKGKSLLSNEEVLLKRRLEEKGFYSLYCPQVVVKHAVPQDRMTKEWFRRRFYWSGVSGSLMRELATPRPAGLVSWSRGVYHALRATGRFTKSWLGERFGRNGERRPLTEFQELERFGCLVGDWRSLLGLI